MREQHGILRHEALLTLAEKELAAFMGACASVEWASHSNCVEHSASHLNRTQECSERLRDLWESLPMIRLSSIRILDLYSRNAVSSAVTLFVPVSPVTTQSKLDSSCPPRAESLSRAYRTDSQRSRSWIEVFSVKQLRIK
jgi:hypothetical protein